MSGCSKIESITLIKTIKILLILIQVDPKLIHGLAAGSRKPPHYCPASGAVGAWDPPGHRIRFWAAAVHFDPRSTLGGHCLPSFIYAICIFRACPHVAQRCSSQDERGISFWGVKYSIPILRRLTVHAGAVRKGQKNVFAKSPTFLYTYHNELGTTKQSPRRCTGDCFVGSLPSQRR